MSKTPAHWKVEHAEPLLNRKTRQLEGMKIVDGTHPIKLRIKACDITGSKKADAENCAAARALKREFGSEVRVYLTRTYVKAGKVWQRFITPQSISREIVAFDRGARFEPGEYLLNAPSKTQRLGMSRASGPMKKKGTSTRPRHFTASVRQMK